MSDKTAEVESITTDRYGRTIGIVYVDGNSLSEEIVKSGYAWVYDRYCKKDMCDKWKKLEELARQSKTGLIDTDKDGNRPSFKLFDLGMSTGGQ